MEEFRQFRNTQYEVSNYGRVFATNFNKTGKRIELKQHLNKSGYYKVNICIKGKRQVVFVHRMVAECFIPNLQNFPMVNHKDENPKNNNVENLEWCDAKYNNNYGEHGAKISKALLNNTFKSKPVMQLDKDGRIIQTFPSVHEAERHLGIATGSIIRCSNGELKTAGGFCWKYVD